MRIGINAPCCRRFHVYDRDAVRLRERLVVPMLDDLHVEEPGEQATNATTITTAATASLRLNRNTSRSRFFNSGEPKPPSPR